MSLLRRRMMIVAVVTLLPCLMLAWLSWPGKRPEKLGPVQGQLRPCPASPNCVCSVDSDPGHAIAPLAYSGSAEAALQRLQRLLQEMPRVAIVTVRGNYLHAEFTSRVFRFVDDVEFLVDPESQVIHCRSASRVGHSDLGVNRARIEQIRARFTQPDALNSAQ